MLNWPPYLLSWREFGLLLQEPFAGNAEFSLYLSHTTTTIPSRDECHHQRLFRVLSLTLVAPA